MARYVNSVPVKLVTKWRDGSITTNSPTQLYTITDQTDTVSRRRPLGIDLFRQGTARSVRRRRMHNMNISIVEDVPFGASPSEWKAQVVQSSLASFDNLSNPGSLRDLDLKVHMDNLIRAQAKAQAVNIAMLLLEYRQTAATFVKLVKDYQDYHNQFRRRLKLGKRRGGSWDRRFANRYLEYTYGVAPLIGDMNQAMSDLLRGVEQKPIVFPVTVRRKQQSSYLAIKPNTSFDPPRAIGSVGEVFETKRFKSKALIELNRSPIVLTLAPFGLLNPALWVWEKIPFSFVADWWVNVGDVLSSLDNLLLVDRIDRIYSTHFIQRVHMRSDVGTNGVYTDSHANRSAPERIPLVSRLEYKPSVSLKHILNGLALCRSIRKDIN